MWSSLRLMELVQAMLASAGAGQPKVHYVVVLTWVAIYQPGQPKAHYVVVLSWVAIYWAKYQPYRGWLMMGVQISHQISAFEISAFEISALSWVVNDGCSNIIDLLLLFIAYQ